MEYDSIDNIIITDRLILRRFKDSDSKDLVKICNNYNLYKSTLSLPSPYTIDFALNWINKQEDNFYNDFIYEYAITDKKSGELYGCMCISNNKSNKNGELGYWVGEKYWGRGYATEAAKAIVEFAFKIKNYHRIYARFFASNPASGKVMQKVGMEYEGMQKEQIFKNGTYEDIVFYGLINNEK